jgi:catalase
VKIHLKTNQGVKNFAEEEAISVAGTNPDHHVQDLFEAIGRKDYPSWTAYIQVMTQQQAETYRWNIFDMTKVWPYKDYPLRPFGKLTLDRNVRLAFFILFVC